MQTTQIERALISVSDKSGLAEFARCLSQSGVELYSTGGTRRFLEEAGLTVDDISAYTGFPEMMDGRLKTLHPKVFGGILYRHDREDDRAALAAHEIASFELVVVNLYPFEQTIARDGVTLPEAIEQIDIGGPSLVRAAAKNHAWTTIVTDPEQYVCVLEQFNRQGGTTPEFRRQLAGAAFARTAAYDRAIADYFQSQDSDAPFPSVLRQEFHCRQTLRYGENPHQHGAFYVDRSTSEACLGTAEQLHGKELSYNNLLDLDSALSLVRELPDSAAVVLKHNNPCGAASAGSQAEAFRRAYEGDSVSAFGSVLGFNQTVNAETAAVLSEPGRFIEAIIAPEFDPEAVQILTTRPKWKANVRLLRTGPLDARPQGWDLRRVEGGLLVQDRDLGLDPDSGWQTVTQAIPSEAVAADLRFAWQVVKHVKSNAIVLVKDRMLLGAGAGQMSRVDSVQIAIEKAGLRAAGSVLGSDAFFPFPDSIDLAAAAGVAAVIQPGGSKQDPDVIEACDRHGLPMIFTGRRHFRH